MKFTIKTEQLQEMVSKVNHCASNNKLIPITSLMSIKVADNKLTLTTTDATNYFYVNAKDDVECADFEVSVIADTFTKLIQKTTSETTTILLENNILEVTGNGTYKLELPLDEDKPIKFANKLPDKFVEGSNCQVIKKSSIDKLLNYNKPALAVDVTIPAMCSYYCGETVRTTDSLKACQTGIKLFDKELLVTPQVMELLGILSDEDICVMCTDDFTLYYTEYDVIYAPIAPGIEQFPTAGFEGLLGLDFPSTCKVNRNEVLELLDRLSLFVSNYDKKAITLTFTNEGIMFSSKKSNGVELVPYVESNDFKPYTCAIDIEFLKAQIGVQEGDTIELSYGSEVAIKMTTGNVIQIIGLIELAEGE